MTVTLNYALQWGILCSDETGNHLLWGENPVGISAQDFVYSEMLYIFVGLGAVLELDLQMFLIPLFVYLLSSCLLQILSLGRNGDCAWEMFWCHSKSQQECGNRRKKV